MALFRSAAISTQQTESLCKIVMIRPPTFALLSARINQGKP